MSEPAPAGDATARAALDELAVLRRRVRADRHALSAPLLVMGIIAAGGATFDLLSELAAERVHTSPGTVVSGWSATFWYWPLAVPAASACSPWRSGGGGAGGASAAAGAGSRW